MKLKDIFSNPANPRAEAERVAAILDIALAAGDSLDNVRASVNAIATRYPGPTRTQLDDLQIIFADMARHARASGFREIDRLATGIQRGELFTFPSGAQVVGVEERVSQAERAQWAFGVDYSALCWAFAWTDPGARAPGMTREVRALVHRMIFRSWSIRDWMRHKEAT